MPSYHHGDLPRQLLTHAAAMAAEEGPATITLRGLARRTGVTHSAPVHHFGTRQGLLTALATDGFTQLNEALAAHAGRIYETAPAYVAWALDHPGHYAVMWQPRLLDESNARLRSARDRAWTLLSSAVDRSSGDSGDRAGAYAAFAVVHGLVSLWLNGALPRPDEPAEFTREITRRLDLA